MTRRPHSLRQTREPLWKKIVREAPDKAHLSDPEFWDDALSQVDDAIAKGDLK